MAWNYRRETTPYGILASPCVLLNHASEVTGAETGACIQKRCVMRGKRGKLVGELGNIAWRGVEIIHTWGPCLDIFSFANKKEIQFLSTGRDRCVCFPTFSTFLTCEQSRRTNNSSHGWPLQPFSGRHNMDGRKWKRKKRDFR